MKARSLLAEDPHPLTYAILLVNPPSNEIGIIRTAGNPLSGITRKNLGALSSPPPLNLPLKPYTLVQLSVINYQALQPVLDVLGIPEGKIIRCLLASMPPGCVIPIHHDTGHWVRHTHRVHVPIITDVAEVCVYACLMAGVRGFVLFGSVKCSLGSTVSARNCQESFDIHCSFCEGTIVQRFQTLSWTGRLYCLRHVKRREHY